MMKGIAILMPLMLLLSDWILAPGAHLHAIFSHVFCDGRFYFKGSGLQWWAGLGRDSCDFLKMKFSIQYKVCRKLFPCCFQGNSRLPTLDRLLRLFPFPVQKYRPFPSVCCWALPCLSLPLSLSSFLPSIHLYFPMSLVLIQHSLSIYCVRTLFDIEDTEMKAQLCPQVPNRAPGERNRHFQLILNFKQHRGMWGRGWRGRDIHTQ